MYVTVSHCPNPDVKGGYWTDPLDYAHSVKIQVASFQEASEVCRKYIDRNNLGAGNWDGGLVFKNRTLVARVSYNGRVWDLEDNEIKI